MQAAIVDMKAVVDINQPMPDHNQELSLYRKDSKLGK